MPKYSPEDKEVYELYREIAQWAHEFKKHEGRITGKLIAEYLNQGIVKHWSKELQKRILREQGRYASFKRKLNHARKEKRLAKEEERARQYKLNL